MILGHGCRQRGWEDGDGRVTRMEGGMSEWGQEGDKRERCGELHDDDS